jgi:hypothetical protein
VRHLKGARFFLQLGALCVAACADSPRPSNDAFGRVIRDVDLPCERVIDVATLGAAKKIWRVACANAETYVAFAEDNGNLCVELLPIGDIRVPANAVLDTQTLDAPKGRCAALN